MKVTHLLYEECDKNLYFLDKEEKLYERVTDKEELKYILENVVWKEVKGKKSNINGRYIYKVFEGHNQLGAQLYYGVRNAGKRDRIYKPVSW